MFTCSLYSIHIHDKSKSYSMTIKHNKIQYMYNMSDVKITFNTIKKIC